MSLYRLSASYSAVDPMRYENPRSAGEWRKLCRRRSMYVVQPSFSQKWVASACLHTRARAHTRAHRKSG